MFQSAGRITVAGRRIVLGFLLTVALLWPAAVWGDTVITQCTEPVLRNALSKGGLVTCACSGTITLTNTITIATNVVLDGTGQSVILSGGGAVRIFTVNTGVNLTLRTVKLSNGKHAGAGGTNGVAAGNGGGGALFNDGGNVAATNCTFSANTATGGNGVNGAVQLNGRGGDGGSGGFAGGGAIYNFGGTVALTNCVFSDNTVTAGTAGNGADGAASGSNDGGRGGDAGAAAGGAIFNAAPGTVAVYDCTFADNSATGAAAGAGGNGAGLGASGSNGGPGTGDGGAIYNDRGGVITTFSTFSDNVATGGAGADGKAGAGDRNGTGGNNGAHAGGGAIFNSSGSLALTNCTFYANIVTGGSGGRGGNGGTGGFGGDGGNGGAGGDGTGGGLYNTGSGTNTVVNCTFSSNGAGGGSGGVGGAAGSAAARAGLNGLSGVALGGGVANGSGVFTLKNTIVTYSASGGEGAGMISDGGNNLSFDASLGLLPASGSYNNEDPGLGNPGNNGGAARTIPILVGASRAVDGGNDAAALPADQRHFARFGRSDIGAFEFRGYEPGALLSIRLQTNQVVLSWSTIVSGYSLQSTPGLSPASWTGVTNAPVISGGQYAVTNSVETERFYRLIR